MAKPAGYTMPKIVAGSRAPQALTGTVFPRVRWMQSIPLRADQIPPSYGPDDGGAGGSGDGGAGGAGKEKSVADLEREIGGRFKSLETRFTKEISAISSGLTKALADALTPISESITAMREGAAGGTGGGGGDNSGGKGGDAGGKGGDSLENHPTILGLRKQVEASNALVKKAQQERDDERRAARNEKRGNQLSAEASRILADAGIEGSRLKGALAVLREQLGHMSEEDDTPVFKDKDGDVDIATGLGSWLKSEEAKIYLPPRGAMGSGDRGTGRTTQTKQPGTIQKGDLGRALVSRGGANLPLIAE